MYCIKARIDCDDEEQAKEIYQKSIDLLHSIRVPAYLRLDKENVVLEEFIGPFKFKPKGKIYTLEEAKKILGIAAEGSPSFRELFTFQKNIGNRMSRKNDGK